jgi:glyoxylase-like metal-dependent hydrolase (beta-lactamase superfamily II)
VAVKEIARGVFYVPIGIANVYCVGVSGRSWVLIDSSVPGRGWQIRRAAESIYGPAARPEAIFLTHGHMDHAGSASELADFWNVPIFAHRLEIPYLTGQSEYPPLDPTTGGFLAFMGRFFAPKTSDLGDRVRVLDRDLPGLDGWEWHHTPGHSPGHVSLFRREDAILLAGDALTTVNLDSFFATVTKTQRLGPPPAPSTYDWVRAAESVRRFVELRPLTIACGHGVPMSGGKAVIQLGELASHFPRPEQGRYVREPAVTDERGVVSLPPKPADALPGMAVGLGIAAAAGAMFAMAAQRRKRKRTATAGTPAQAS